MSETPAEKDARLAREQAERDRYNEVADRRQAADGGLPDPAWGVEGWRVGRRP